MDAGSDSSRVTLECGNACSHGWCGAGLGVNWKHVSSWFIGFFWFVLKEVVMEKRPGSRT